MSAAAWIQFAVFAGLIALLTKPVGAYLYRVYESPSRPRALAWLERLVNRLSGIDSAREQTWSQYAWAVMLFSLAGILGTYTLLRLQHLLPFNPQAMGAVEPCLAWNTAVAFATNTNWQSYAGETTMSHGSQMSALAWHNFTSAAVGIGVALALARGITRQAGAAGSAGTIGNFWADTVRGLVYILLPGCVVLAVVFVAGGVIQNLSASAQIVTIEGASQTIAMGPVASQEAIKMLGTNGGGFFNANSAHPFENPSPWINLIEMLLIFVIPAGLTWTYGRMAGRPRQGWALWSAMSVLFVLGAVVCSLAESRPNPALAGLGVDQSTGNWEGKESRFGIGASALFATVTTDASCGAVNAMHDSFTAIGGMVPLVDMQLGEVVFGGVGAGLTGILVMAVLTVFICGLMVGRTPELLGKKIEAREVTFAMIYALVFPFAILAFAGWAAVAPCAVSSLNNAGPHGLSELIYAFTSAAANNGSAFAGLNANTPFWNTTLGLAMFAGRFWLIIPALAIAGALAGKRTVPTGPGTMSTGNALFVVLLLGVIVIVSALTFFPALCLGPIVEHLAGGAGRQW